MTARLILTILAILTILSKVRKNCSLVWEDGYPAQRCLRGVSEVSQDFPEASQGGQVYPG